MSPTIRLLARLAFPLLLLVGACGGGEDGPSLLDLTASFRIGPNPAELSIPAGGAATPRLEMTCVFNSTGINIEATNAAELARSDILTVSRRGDRRCETSNGARNANGDALYEGSTDWPITVLDTTPPGRYRVDFLAVTANFSETERTTLLLNVTAPANGAFSLATPPDALVRAQHADIPITVERIDYAGAIALTVTPIGGDGIPDRNRMLVTAPAELPAGATTATMAVDYTTETRPGDRVIVTATGGGVSRSQVVRLRTDSLAPPTPSGFTAAGAFTAITLAWANDRAALEYQIERATSDNGPFVPIATLAAPATSHVDQGLPANTRFVYRLTARNAQGISSPAIAAASTLQDLVLTVTVNGNGTVVSEPAGINCGTDCSEVYALDTQVRLIATPAAGQSAGSFGGDADCSDGVVTITRPMACTVTFVPLPGSGWQQLGTALTDRSTVLPAFSLALDEAGIRDPLVAYVESSPRGDPARLYVKRLDGVVWNLLGTGALNAGSTTAASDPSLATRIGSPIHVAWSQGNGEQQNVFVARFNGTTWESVGAAGAPLNYVAGSRAVRPSLAFDVNGQPQVAWIENGAVKWKRFDGTNWVASTLGGEGPASANVDRVRLATTPFAPVLAWTEGPVNDRKLKVAHGQSFTLLGQQVNAPFNVPVTITHFGLRPEESGAIVMWTQDERPFSVFARRWEGDDRTGRSWADFGAPPLNIDTNLLLSFAMARNSVDVAFSLQPLATAPFATAFQRSAGQWVAVPSLVTPGVPLRNIQLEFLATNSPIVAGIFANPAEQLELRVYRHFP